MDSLNLTNTGEETLYYILTPEKQEDYSIEKHRNESLAYLKDVSSFNIHKLQQEPVKLKEENDHINEEIESLAFSNYKTFIRAAQCSRELYQDFNLIETKLDSLVDKIPDFTVKCENFTKNIQNLNAARRINNLTLQRHNQLLEILEISQLMDTCVRNEYYEEALELAAYVKRLEKKFSAQIPLIQQIVDDVKQSLQLMLKQLLQQLKTNIQFPTCLKIIGLIRRLDIYTESQLRIKFLQLRDCWLQKLLDNIPKDDMYHYISKTVDENRVHLFDIITQYKALFSDDDLTVSLQQNSNGYLLNSQQKDLSESKLFNCWILDKITRFLNTLKEVLKNINNQNNGIGNRLDSVLSQAMYFGLAFSRVGLDFRVLIIEVFEMAAYDQMKDGISAATNKFEEYLHRFSLSDFVSTSTDSNAPNDQNSSVLMINANKKTSLNPPIKLIEFQPLAIYLNHLLQCFNDFRLCAPVNLFAKIKQLLQGSLCRVSVIISVYLKSEQNIFDDNEKELIKKFLRIYAYELVPYVEKCYSVLFPISQIQKSFSIQQNDLEKLKVFFQFDQTKIFEPIKTLLPPQVERLNVSHVEEQQKIENEVETVEVSKIEEEPNIDSKSEEPVEMVEISESKATIEDSHDALNEVEENLETDKDPVN